MKYILMVIFLSLPISAHADWGNAQMHPVMGSNFVPPVHVEPEHRVDPPQAAEHHVPGL